MKNRICLVHRSSDGINCLYIDGQHVSSERSQKIHNHSPDGFNWGYSGSGPLQCALGILLHVLNDTERATRWYRKFAQDVLSRYPQGRSYEFIEDIQGWVEVQEAFDNLTRD